MTANYRVLITGANRGLGLAMTIQFLEKGHQVISYSRKNSEILETLLQKYPEQLLLHLGDVTSEDEVQKASQEIGKQIEGLDILINNAAVHLEQSAETLEQLNFENYLQSFEINSVAPLKVAKHFVPLLRQGNKKLLVNISSEAGSIADAWRKAEYSYCMSKAALNMSGQILQNDLKTDGIKVLNIHPGWFTSDMGGEKAPTSPNHAAKDVCETICSSWTLEDPLYVDPKGNPMNW